MSRGTHRGHARTASVLVMSWAAWWCLFPAPRVGRADAIDDEYYARVKELKSDDIVGRLRLAVWCRDQERWQLAARECGEILKRQPGHEQAQLLLNLARAHLDVEGRHAGAESGAGGVGRPVELTDDEVQRVRRAELNLEGDEHVRLKIDRDALNAFYEQGKRDGLLAMERAAFFRLPRLEQARLILRYAPETFGDKIEMASDPERMRVYLRDVQPVVLRGCATSECHGGPSAGRLRLLAGRTLSGTASYTNYFILEGGVVGNERMINRDLPERSLLLSYGLPRGVGVVGHPTEIVGAFKDEEDRDYKTVLNWISSMPITRPDYGIQRPDLVRISGSEGPPVRRDKP